MEIGSYQAVHEANTAGEAEANMSEPGLRPTPHWPVCGRSRSRSFRCWQGREDESRTLDCEDLTKIPKYLTFWYSRIPVGEHVGEKEQQVPDHPAHRIFGALLNVINAQLGNPVLGIGHWKVGIAGIVDINRVAEDRAAGHAVEVRVGDEATLLQSHSASAMLLGLNCGLSSIHTLVTQS